MNHRKRLRPNPRKRGDLPLIGISPGDPGGIGPEIVLKALAGSGPFPGAAYIIFGDSRILEKEAATIGLRPSWKPWREEEEPEEGLYLREVPGPERVSVGKTSAENGKASFRSFEEAVAAARKGRLQAVVTAPISKASWGLAGIPWRGHTEYLERFYPKAVMSFWSEKLKVALLSHHLPLREALDKIKKKTLLGFFRTLRDGLDSIGCGGFEILVAGLNPHAGEGGLLGREEEDEVKPAIQEAKREGILISGPFPPDTVFLQARGRPEWIVAALYHDQGLVAFKLEAFSSGVNMTLGLPFIRTSPDHGTAFDIAGRGCADPGSMVEALKLARALLPPARSSKS